MFDDLLKQFSGGTDFRKFGAVVDSVWDQRDSLGDAIEFFAANRDQMTKALGFMHDHGDEILELIRAVPDILGQAGAGIEAAGKAATTASRFLSGDGDSLTADRALTAASATLDRCQGLVGDVARLVAAIGDRFSGIPFVGEATEVLRQGGQCVDDVARQLGDASTMIGRLGTQLGEAGSDLNQAGQQLASSGAALRQFGIANARPVSPERPWALVAAAEVDDAAPTGPIDEDAPQSQPKRVAAETAPRTSRAGRSTAKQASTTRGAKKTPAKKTSAKKTPARTTAAGGAARKTASKKTPAKKTPAKKTAKRAPTKRTAAKKTAKRAPTKRAAANKTPAKKTSARKTPAKRS